ncbi:MAG: cysteine hydrolase [Oscillospiraceae bacterium]|nr:cysteine hydrolase [Ruminococcus sp.]MCD8345753.1 cysteine hydrolase [Oscillospiraceae bacterium]
MKTLIVIDMQVDFITGALGTAEAVSIVPAVQKKVQDHLAAGGTVIYTRDTHTSDYLSTQEGRNLPVVHCVKGTPGWEIADGVYAEGCKVVDKPSFGSTELPRVLAEIPELESIELVGLCTDICVISNAMILKAAFPEVPITVDSSCCAGVTPESHENALRAMAVCQIKIA